MQDRDRWGWEQLLGIEREEFPPYSKSLSNGKKANLTAFKFSAAFS